MGALVITFSGGTASRLTRLPLLGQKKVVSAWEDRWRVILVLRHIALELRGGQVIERHLVFRPEQVAAPLAQIGEEFVLVFR